MPKPPLTSGEKLTGDVLGPKPGSMDFGPCRRKTSGTGGGLPFPATNPKVVVWTPALCLALLPGDLGKYMVTSGPAGNPFPGPHPRKGPESREKRYHLAKGPKPPGIRDALIFTEITLTTHKKCLYLGSNVCLYANYVNQLDLKCSLARSPLLCLSDNASC
jgi:hypothetical protein